jgi:hypothetical protein
MQADTTCFICLYLMSQYMQIKFVCTKTQAVHICMYQCTNTYRCRQIQPALSACISESIHANKTCLYPDTGNSYLSVSMLQIPPIIEGAVADAPGPLGQLLQWTYTQNLLRLGTRTDRCAGIDPAGLPCGIGRALQGHCPSAARGGAQKKSWHTCSGMPRMQPAGSEPEPVTARLSKLAEGGSVCAVHHKLAEGA